jgi:hypothetical protein
MTNLLVLLEEAAKERVVDECAAIHFDGRHAPHKECKLGRVVEREPGMVTRDMFKSRTTTG